jgi:F420-dependent oxidoreductase-like protein
MDGRIVRSGMRFGIQIEPQYGFTYEDVRDIARDAEARGFTGLWVSDHLFLDENAAATNCLEAWTLLAALARETRTLRLGTMVTAVSYRNPALLAKLAAGVDVMSGGRLEFGIGAGWKELEYRAYGYEFPPPSVRIDQLVDALEICLRMWREERATYRGKYHSVQEAFCMPKPVQRPKLPVWIGGSKPRMLALMARYADGVNIGGFPTLEVYAAAMRALDDACRSVGRDPRAITRSHFTPCVIAETRRDLDATLDELAAKAKTSRDEWRRARPSAIVGTPEEVVERLRAFAGLGCSYYLPVFPYTHETRMLRLLSKHVMPALA